MPSLILPKEQSSWRMLRRIDQPFTTFEKNRNIFSKNIPFAVGYTDTIFTCYKEEYNKV